MKTPLDVTKSGEGSSRFVAIHGWGGSHATFEPLKPFMPDSVLFEAVDLPGYGTSELPDEWKTEVVGEMVADSISPDEDVTVVGNCTGGVIGAELALLQPNRVKRLVMIDPFAYMPWYFSIFLKGSFGRMAYMTTFASPIGRFFTNQALRSKRTRDSDLTASFERVNHAAVHDFLRMVGAHEGPSRYAHLQLPVDVIMGEKTFGAVRKSSRILEQEWPDVRIHVIPGAGHLPIEEQTERVAEVVFGND